MEMSETNNKQQTMKEVTSPKSLVRCKTPEPQTGDRQPVTGDRPGARTGNRPEWKYKPLTD